MHYSTIFFFHKTQTCVYLRHIFYWQLKHLLIPFFIDAKNSTVESVMIYLTSPMLMSICYFSLLISQIIQPWQILHLFVSVGLVVPSSFFLKFQVSRFYPLFSQYSLTMANHIHSHGFNYHLYTDASYICISNSYLPFHVLLYMNCLFYNSLGCPM